MSSSSGTAPFERLGKACVRFRLNRTYVTDGRFLFVPPDATDFCPLCFERRHRAQFPAAPELHSLPPAALELARQFDKAARHTDEWVAQALKPGAARQNFRLFGFEDCPRCQPPQAALSPAEAAEYYELKLTGPSPDFNPENLSRRVFSFGFAHRAMMMNRSRLDDPRLTNLIADGHHARVLYRMVVPDGRFTDAATTGYDTDPAHASLKALMEYAERYAFNLHVTPARAERADPELIDGYMQLYRRPLSAAEKKQAENEAVWGVDLLRGTPRAIPLPFLFSYQAFRDVKPTSSGYGAHGSFGDAVASGIVELVERDAFVRFWHDPGRARLLELPPPQEQALTSVAAATAAAATIPPLTSRAFLIPSPLRIPVVLLAISSDHPEQGPALLFGFGAGLTLDEAAYGALRELRLNAMNLVRALKMMPDLLTQHPPAKVDGIAQRMQLYASAVPRPHLRFLDEADMAQADDCTSCPPDLDALLDRFRNAEIDIHAVDCTPECLADLGVHVVRAFSTGLYPLQFEREDTLSLPRSDGYAGKHLSHFFL
ncbi:YcaO-like family protein [Thiohalobacter sp.]|uniref:YcaO-like family protein n=1 Tax=Thiohalobacter sp. TaxID=2025948 RepID=UPI0026163847|nr:YcaO-like family protein [Thiohalobacter sp.]